MECFSGVGAAAVAAGAASTFSYNRNNFQGDREQRRRASVMVMKWRVDQATLWRQDVRDLISLTEYKMHMYLIINVLVLGFTIFLWTEGRLPSGTPHWLMVGNIISIGTAFMFLLLSIWLAMHAAISAQSFEARLLTQMVRLPIPTWEEFEATRTYGSEFEKLEGRQMFRVPWLMGWQETLVGHQPPAGSAVGDPEPTVDLGHTGNPDIGHPPEPGATATAGMMAGAGSSPPTATANATGAAATAGQEPAQTEEWNTDPWGLEQAAEGMPELGCGLGSDVAKLRHVKLSRQAAIQWQTFDAFSRISMSLGVQSLLQAMSYYILGYLLVEVGCKTAAVFGVIVFTMVASNCVTFDMTLAPTQFRLAQCLLVFGPACSLAAALAWSDFANNAAEFIVPIAFISHGLYFALIAAFCRIRVAENGAWLPVAFRSVLYLDVFSWTRGQMGPPTIQRNAQNFQDAGPQAGKPAIQSVRYVDGLPVPLRPEDLCPEGVTRDLRNVPGAPDILRPASGMEGKDEAFYNPASFLPLEDAEEEDDEASYKHGWSEKVGPGELPWRVVCVSMLLVCCLWLGSAVYCVHGSKTSWSLDLPINEIRRRDVQVRPGFVGPDSDSLEYTSDQAMATGPWWEHIKKDHARNMQWEQWSQNMFGNFPPRKKPASFLAGKTARRVSVASTTARTSASKGSPCTGIAKVVA